MSVQSVWLNLPVKDLAASRNFFKAIGFRSNPMHDEHPEMGSFFIGAQDFVLMLFPEQVFSGFVRHAVADTAKGSEVLINIDARSRDEVDAMAETVRKAGGRIYAGPGEAQGWMYALGFEDLDGHRWNMLYMDMEKMPR